MSRYRSTLALLSSLISLALGSASFAGDRACVPGWVPTFGQVGGVGDWSNALLSYDDGSGPVLVVGGEFVEAGGVAASRVAQYDGEGWGPFGNGIPTHVRSLAAHGPHLYAGSDFGIMRSNGGMWANTNGGVASAMVEFDSGSGPVLYAATAGGVSHWTGSSWSSVPLDPNGAVHALCVWDDGSGPKLYVGGSFSLAGGLPAMNVAAYDGTSWHTLGGGTSDLVRALAPYDDGTGSALYVGGAFTLVDETVPASRMARWDGTAWSALAGGVSDTVWALEAWDDGSGPSLFVGGQFASFASSNGAPSAAIARWDGTQWSSVGTGMNLAVHALEVHDDGGGEQLYATGKFSHASGVGVRCIARWDGTAWRPVAAVPGLSSYVEALTAFDDGRGAALYAGGWFEHVGIQPLARVGRWDGSGWTALGDVGGVVHALIGHDDGSGADLHAGGAFGVKRWDAGAWTPLAGIPGTVLALATHDEGIGPVLVAGGGGAGGVRRWDGAGWHVLGSGLSPVSGAGGVSALLWHDDGNGPQLYAGGTFTTAGATSVNYVARWDGVAWSDLAGGMGTEMEGGVDALTVFDDGTGPLLVAAGRFASAGGVAVQNIAAWDGTSWAPLGGLAARVRSLAVHDDGSGAALFAGGWFTSPSRIARWNGAAWDPVGQGVGGITSQIPSVEAMISWDDGSGPGLFAGGTFQTAHDSGDAYLAKWGCEVEPSVTFCFGDAADCPCGNGGAPGRGCDNAQGTGGVELALVVQATSPNAVTVTGSGFSTTGSPTALVFRSPGTEPSPVVFGDGLRCVAATPLVRLAATVATGGSSTHVFGHGAMAGSGDFYYQIWYRNQPASFCTPFAFNLSNGLRITW